MKTVGSTKPAEEKQETAKEEKQETAKEEKQEKKTARKKAE